MITYAELSQLTGGKIGVFDTACPVCGPDRRSSENRKRKVLRIWLEPGFASWHCPRCPDKGWARDSTNTGNGISRVPPLPDVREKLERLRKEAAERDRLHGERRSR